MKSDKNDCAYSDPNSESSKRPFKHGHFYDGNMTTSAKDRLKLEGSKGLARNQGMVRTSAIPEMDRGGDIGQTSKRNLKIQGSHAQLGFSETKVKREI